MRQSLTPQTPTPPPTRARFASLDDAPVVLTLDELAQIYRCSPHTIRRRLEAGTFTPAPIKRRPYRWRKDDVIDDLDRLADEAARSSSSSRRRRASRRSQ